MTLLRPARASARPLTRGLSSSASARAPPARRGRKDLEETYENPGGHAPMPAPRISDLTKADLHTPIVFRTPVPRSPDFPTRFPDAPVHEHINYPHRLFEPVPPGQMPEAAGEKPPRNPFRQAVTGISQTFLRKASYFTIHSSRVANMTTGGRVYTITTTEIVGIPELGLVGLARGKGPEPADAQEKAREKAILSMDYVNRFEGRTVWGQGKELVGKWGTTVVSIRARPPGFGLQVPLVLHHLFTACGIQDASASIEGSRHPVNVAKAALQVLHPGFGPPGLGSGKGTSGRREDKGAGMRSVTDLQRQRGRYAVEVTR